MAVSCVQLLGLIALATFALAISPIDHSHDRHRHEDPDDDVIIEATKEKFENVIEELDFVAVVFYTKNCKECDEALRELEYIDDDLDKYGIEMIKINNIEVAAEHGVTTFPTLIFWRREDPILYEGKFDDREVFDWLIHHKNSYVKVLTDDNFERVTQAASGATTGDWFVLLNQMTRNFLLSMAAACIGLISAATLMIVVFTGLGYLKINSDNMVPHKIDKTQ
ncbi:PREDICTED: uncharacterized protein LOC106813241 [Priapulus caudatus]|uniref:Uncharacterized protein LOC106813241 n=1 Tax=Priapulus caudatus TaxID=37621 RepID=A0ABM1EKU6_PRICU|nr:PREDICTED: uncharacterized protein LOC106813241 [Priapulus caudatus]